MRDEDLFAKLDKDKSGYIEPAEIRHALQELGLPCTDGVYFEFLSDIDEDKDGRISLQEFREAVQRKREELRRHFKLIDVDNDGAITIEELDRGLRSADMILSRIQLNDIFRKLDANNDGKISEHEWVKALALLPMKADTFRVSFEVWERQQAGNAQEDIILPNESKKTNLEAKVLKAWQTFACGGLAGCVSRTCTAPIDRLKTLMQLSNGGQMSMVQNMKTMYKEGGIRGMFRGNFVNCLKVAPQNGIQWVTFDFLSKLLKVPHDNPYQGTVRFVSGSVAGLISQTIVYPMDTVKTRMTAGAKGQYRGMVHCASLILKNDGAKAFFRGWNTAMLGAIPYSGVDLYTYGLLKNMYRQYSNNPEPPAYVMLGAGTMSSAVAQMCTYPFALVRARLQAQGMSPDHPVLYSGLSDCVSKTWKQGGVPALYRGILPNLLKGAPAAGVSYFVFETTKKFFLER